jgi:trehalose 6-phosphate phosphatase
VKALITRAAVGRALYAGDDTTDVDAFAGLDGLEVAVRVAVDSREAPRALREAADLVVDGTGGVLELLRRL